jgi:hypothetical protein
MYQLRNIRKPAGLGSEPMSESGQNAKYSARADVSRFFSNSDIARRGPHFAFVPILLQKSFWGGERKFLEPLMRLTRGDVRDHIVSSKIDRGSPQSR